MSLSELIVYGYIHTNERLHHFYMTIPDSMFQLVYKFYPKLLNFTLHDNLKKQFTVSGYTIKGKDLKTNQNCYRYPPIIYAGPNIRGFNEGVHRWSIKNINYSQKLQPRYHGIIHSTDADAIDIYNRSSGKWLPGFILSVGKKHPVTANVYYSKDYIPIEHAIEYDSGRLALKGTYTETGCLRGKPGRIGLTTSQTQNNSGLCYSYGGYWELDSIRTVILDCDKWCVSYYTNGVLNRKLKIASGEKYYIGIQLSPKQKTTALEVVDF
eukprot:233240_1